jgi:RimJ/RimL family protein N-acetyltransferase
MVIPELETERTVMRGWREDDLDAYAEWMSDPEVTRFIGGLLDRNEAWRRMSLLAGHWLLRGYGPWIVERKQDGMPLGRVGLWNPEGWPAIEVGWTLRREAWGQGYAQETARAAMQWAWDELELEELISVIDPRNAASIAVAHRLGMHFREEHLLFGDRPVLLYEIKLPT